MRPSFSVRGQPFARRLLMAWLGALAGLACAQGESSGAGPFDEPAMTQWLSRVHAAPRRHNYVGTMVVSSQAGAMSSARVWHASDADQRQIERVEALSGPPRSSFRHGDKVVTLLPRQKLVRIERNEALGRFPDLLRDAGTAIAEFYAARPAGADRIAGFDADVVLLAPRDAWRFGYRVWTERKTGLVVKLQTLGPMGAVLEQSAFSELQLDAPLRMDALVKMMTPPRGWRVERSRVIKTTVQAEGWQLKTVPPGFHPVDCYRRATGAGAMQCVFSDGLASVSLFVEPLTGRERAQAGRLSAGATHTLTRRLPDWWVTAVGEVPPQTLDTFVQSLERRQ